MAVDATITNMRMPEARAAAKLLVYVRYVATSLAWSETSLTPYKYRDLVSLYVDTFVGICGVSSIVGEGRENFTLAN
jgi:hypothetical protein